MEITRTEMRVDAKMRKAKERGKGMDGDDTSQSTTLQVTSQIDPGRGDRGDRYGPWGGMGSKSWSRR